MTSAAIISTCGTYRYTLHRSIPSVLRWVKPCLFVMLNPSTADATKDDPTIRRCVGFAKREGCTGMTVVNLFALRATDPAELAKHADPFGPDDEADLAALVALQGKPRRKVTAAKVLALIARDGEGGAKRRTTTIIPIENPCAEGHPRHPLYIKGDQPLVPWVRP